MEDLNLSRSPQESLGLHSTSPVKSTIAAAWLTNSATKQSSPAGKAAVKPCVWLIVKLREDKIPKEG
jgi:hypothetical protein